MPYLLPFPCTLSDVVANGSCRKYCLYVKLWI